jgi:hypothetical protein
MTQTTEQKSWLVGGDEHMIGVCDSCGEKAAVAHIGYTEGKLGSYVYHCVPCISDGRTVEHYSATSHWPYLTQAAQNVLGFGSPVGAAQVTELDLESKSVVECPKSESNSAKSAQGASMQDAKKGTKNAGKSKKSVDAVEAEASVSRKFHVDKEFDSGKVRFVPDTKEPEVSGSVYILTDLMPEGCKNAIITIEFKEA